MGTIEEVLKAGEAEEVDITRYKLKYRGSLEELEEIVGCLKGLKVTREGEDTIIVEYNGVNIIEDGTYIGPIYTHEIPELIKGDIGNFVKLLSYTGNIIYVNGKKKPVLLKDPEKAAENLYTVSKYESNGFEGSKNGLEIKEESLKSYFGRIPPKNRFLNVDQKKVVER